MLRGLVVGAISIAAVGCSRDATTAEGGEHPPAVTSPGPSARPANAISTAAPTRSVRRDVPFDGGIARLEAERGLEHVLLLGPDGSITGESWCLPPMAGYDTVRAFFTEIRAAILNGDVDHVATLTAFPLRINAGATRLVTSREQFVREQAQILTPEVVERVRASNPGEVFCGNDGQVLGDGVLWAELQSNSRLAIWAINVGPGPRRRTSPRPKERG